MKTTVSLIISDKKFNVSCDVSEREGLSQAAYMVDQHIEEIKQHGNTVGSEKVAIMAALNIAIEFMQLKDKNAGSENNNDKVVDDILKNINEAIVRFK